VIALGDRQPARPDGSISAGCDDYIDRAARRDYRYARAQTSVTSKAEGSSPRRCLRQADTSLSGSPPTPICPACCRCSPTRIRPVRCTSTPRMPTPCSVFDAGEIRHANAASLFGDEAVVHIVKNVHGNGNERLQFVYGSTSPQHTVLRNATESCSMHAEFDEGARDMADKESAMSEAMIHAARSGRWRPRKRTPTGCISLTKRHHARSHTRLLFARESFNVVRPTAPDARPSGLGASARGQSVIALYGRRRSTTEALPAKSNLDDFAHGGAVVE